MQKPVSPNIAELSAGLKACSEDLATRVETRRAAEREETACRNRLNELQQQFDAAVEQIRKAAPNDSDWGRKTAENQRLMAPVGADG